jgi:hypothetical protein
MNRIKRLYEFKEELEDALDLEKEDLELELNIEEEIISKIVDLVGSEEKVEAAAEMAYEELLSSFENNEVEIEEEDLPQNLALASLIIKLVELGDLDPEEADSFLQEVMQ